MILLTLAHTTAVAVDAAVPKKLVNGQEWSQPSWPLPVDKFPPHHHLLFPESQSLQFYRILNYYRLWNYSQRPTNWVIVLSMQDPISHLAAASKA
jgi:hypothetical protein